MEARDLRTSIVSQKEMDADYERISAWVDKARLIVEEHAPNRVGWFLLERGSSGARMYSASEFFEMYADMTNRERAAAEPDEPESITSQRDFPLAFRRPGVSLRSWLAPRRTSRSTLQSQSMISHCTRTRCENPEARRCSWARSTARLRGGGRRGEVAATSSIARRMGFATTS
jgi:hypothetical protein